jgi:hypothetical protein
MATIKTGWLTDINDNKFAPKTAAKSVILTDGTNVEQKTTELSRDINTLENKVNNLTPTTTIGGFHIEEDSLDTLNEIRTKQI